MGFGPAWKCELEKPMSWHAAAHEEALGVGVWLWSTHLDAFGTPGLLLHQQQKNRGDPRGATWAELSRLMLWMTGTVQIRVPPTIAPRRSSSRRVMPSLRWRRLPWLS